MTLTAKLLTRMGEFVRSEVDTELGKVCVKYLCSDAYKVVNPSIWRIWQTQITQNHSFFESLVPGAKAFGCATPLLLGVAYLESVREIICKKSGLSDKDSTLLLMGCTALAGRALFEKVDSPTWKLAIIIGSFVSGSGILAKRFPFENIRNFRKLHHVVKLCFTAWALSSLYLRTVFFKNGVHPVPAMLLLGVIASAPYKEWS